MLVWVSGLNQGPAKTPYDFVPKVQILLRALVDKDSLPNPKVEEYKFNKPSFEKF